MQATLKNISLIAAKAYAPRWLADSMVEGQFSDVRLHLRGDLAEFPFVQNSGIFKLNAKVAGLTLENIPAWPPIENITGNLKFHGSRAELDVSQADILGSNLTKARLHIADLSDPNAILNSEIEATGATRQFVKFAAQTIQTTARDRFGGMVDQYSHFRKWKISPHV